MLQRIQNLEKAVRYLAGKIHKHEYYADGSKLTLIDDELGENIKEILTPRKVVSIDTQINSALIKGGFKDCEIKQLEQCLRFCLHRTKSHNFCGLSKAGIREKEINNLLEKIK